MKWSIVSIANLTDEEYDYWFSLMSQEKKNRVNNYKDSDDKKRTVAGEMIARKLISEHCTIAPESIVFSIGPYGKPQVKNANINFNISHSDELVICCVSTNQIGIDIEKIKPLNINILNKVCTCEDIEYIYDEKVTNCKFPLSREELKRFYEIWTAKEAYFKCIGTGIKNLKNITISMLPNARTIFWLDAYVVTIIEKI